MFIAIYENYSFGIILFVREDIPAKLIGSEKPVESSYVELNLANKLFINLSRQKWLINCSYNTSRVN